RLPLGDRRQGPVVLGPVADLATTNRCNDLIDDALNRGARLLCGGKSETVLMPATLLDHVTPDMKIFREESFAPVKSIIRVDGEDAAVAWANDTEYGVSAGGFSKGVLSGGCVAAPL